MNGQWQAFECRLLDLLADRATFGLTRSEAEELRQLTECVPDFDDESMEKAAATVQLAFTSVEPLPAVVTRRFVIPASGTLPNRHGSDPKLLAPCDRSVRRGPASGSRTACLAELSQHGSK